MCDLSVYAYVRNVYLWYMYLYARLLGIGKGGWMGRDGYTVYVCVLVCVCVCGVCVSVCVHVCVCGVCVCVWVTCYNFYAYSVHVCV